MNEVAWIAADWGTTNLRLWALGANDEVVDSCEAQCGMASLNPSEFEHTLLQHIQNWLPGQGEAVPVIACGMVGAKQGWQEVPYVSVPSRLEPVLNPIATHEPRVRVYICSGLSQSQPADVMRGEETQIAGLVFNEPQFSGAVCLPGTHSKWSVVRAGEILNFQSFMTGEIFGLLAEQSVLRFSVDSTDWSSEAFAKAVSEAFNEPATVVARLFSLRAEGLVAGNGSSRSAVSRLSGFLIGLELAAAQEYWKNAEDVVLIGNAKLSSHYLLALEVLGVNARMISAEYMTLEGLKAARNAVEALSDV